MPAFLPLRRQVLLALAATPVGCALRSLPPLNTQTLPAPPGPVAMRPARLGQTWTYRQLNHFNGELLAEVQETVAAVGERVVVQRQTSGGKPLPTEHHGPWGQLLRDPVWDYPLNLEQAVPLWPVTLAPGQSQRVNTHYLQDGGSYRHWVQVHAVARGWERVVLPAGTFDTVRAERLIRLAHHDVNRAETLRRDVLWLSPGLGRWVVRETSGRYLEPDGDKLGGSEQWEDHFRWEIVDWC